MRKIEAKKILVISDTHEYFYQFLPIYEKMTDIDYVIVLGDTESESEYMEYIIKQDKSIIRGNCDFFKNDLPYEEILQWGKYKLFLTHGHEYGVKRSLDDIYEKAKQEGCQYVLFGHTHINCIKKIHDIFLVNPGSIRDSILRGKASYLIMEMAENEEIILTQV